MKREKRPNKASSGGKGGYNEKEVENPGLVDEALRLWAWT